MKKSVLIVVFILTCIVIYAQQNERIQSKTEITVEIDPVTFGFKGYGLHFKIKPKNTRHLMSGFGIYAMNFPNILIDLNKKNKDKGWNVRLNQGIGIFLEHHFFKVNKKWFTGGQLAMQHYKIENQTLNNVSEKFTNYLFMVYGGYTWQLFDFGLYIKPWAGIGYTSKISGTNKIENSEYFISPIMMFATLHIGYTF